MSAREQYLYRMGYERRAIINGGGHNPENSKPRMTMEEFLARRAEFNANPDLEKLPEPPPYIPPPKYDRHLNRLVPTFYKFPETVGRKLLKVIDLQRMPIIETKELALV
jgi:hypothetical protein